VDGLLLLDQALLGRRNVVLLEDLVRCVESGNDIDEPLLVRQASFGSAWVILLCLRELEELLHEHGLGGRRRAVADSNGFGLGTPEDLIHDSDEIAFSDERAFEARQVVAIAEQGVIQIGHALDLLAERLSGDSNRHLIQKILKTQTR